MIESISKETFFSIESLKLSWKRYLRATQAEVKDHVGIDYFGWNFDENIKRLHEKIDEKDFYSSSRTLPCVTTLAFNIFLRSSLLYSGNSNNCLLTASISPLSASR